MTNELSVEEAIELLKEKRMEINYQVNGTTQFSEALDIGIKALEQQPKTGHWITDVYIFGRGRHTCSNCGKGQEYTTAFCSWCGAKMEVIP